MVNRIVSITVFSLMVTLFIASAQASEPTWLFTVPKAESLEESAYNIGLLYADFGLTENIEVGIHGLKYSMPESDLAFGLSLYPMATPYVVKSLDMGSGELHVGLKAAPYLFFAGFETPVSDSVKFIAELNNGGFVGVRIFPAQKWTLDIFAAFINLEVYRYKYGRIDVDEFRIIPGISFAYSDTF